MRADEQLIRGAALLGRGDLAGAHRVAEAAIARFPDHAGLQQLLGAVRCTAGDLQRGVVALRKALELEPGNLKTRLNLARALGELRMFEEAQGLCSDAAHPELARMLGDILKLRGMPGDAISAYRKAVGLQPGHFEAWNNLGNTLRECGDLDGAEAALRRATALQPAHALCHLNLARVLNDAKRHAEAVLSLREAARIAPDASEIFFELGTTLAAMGRHEESLIPLEKACEIDPRSARALSYLGVTLVALERENEAEAAYRKALEIAPADVDAHLFLGILLEESNRIAELEELLCRAERLGVQPVRLAVLHARLLKRQGRIEEALQILDQVTDANALVKTLRAQLTGEINDRLGDADQAFAAFEEMNRLRAAEPGAKLEDGRRYLAHIERLNRLTTADWIAGWNAAEIDTSRTAPVFLVGFPRSGTTLLDTILLAHPATFVLEESMLLSRVSEEIGDPLNVANLDSKRISVLRERYFAGLDAIPGAKDARLIIDKSPLHMTLGAFIHRVFPDAKFIFSLRHPCDVVLSCFMQNLWANAVGSNFLDIRSTALLYDRIMSYWSRCRALLPLQVHELRYESLVADIEGELRALLNFLGIEWSDSILDYRRTAYERGHIGTPSYAQVTEKLYSRAIGRWQRYRPHMAPALSILAPWTRQFGYGEI